MKITRTCIKYHIIRFNNNKNVFSKEFNSISKRPRQTNHPYLIRTEMRQLDGGDQMSDIWFTASLYPADVSSGVTRICHPFTNDLMANRDNVMTKPLFGATDLSPFEIGGR